ncbi:uncharacterized protein LOC124537487 isoform X3 [Vanessa cardui]|uniref:uncharacterized protein LOC124537487 isoform X3 n=1 Tax=Vanessa cardui TaxID=171605 RepID=UPI001F13572D|nr:uncharacterized protein LOC124537487 isoform X3 [Vanessa cardui]
MVLRDSTSIFYYFISMLDSPEESQQSTSCSEDENSQSQPTMSPKFEFVETPKWCYDAKKWWNLAKVIHMLGQHIEGQWVLGMIEDGSEDLRLEVCPNNIKTAEVLVPLIQKHVAEGTTIYINVGEAYDSLKDHNYVLKKLTDYFPANPLCMHTQKIESQWNVVKQFFSKDLYNREYLADFIIEYLWRRHIKINKCDPFEELIKAVKHVYKH